MSFGICGGCNERHALQASGAMSIHTTVVGDRCAGIVLELPPDPTGNDPLRRAVSESFAELAYGPKSWGSTPEPRLYPRQPSKKEKGELYLEEVRQEPSWVDDEFEAAAEVGRDHKRNKYDPGANRRLDRSIYAVKGSTHIVRGGLPTLGGNR